MLIFQEKDCRKKCSTIFLKYTEIKILILKEIIF